MNEITDESMTVHEAAQAWAKDPMWAQKDWKERARCWICNTQMHPETWASAPREPSDEWLRWCHRCHNTVEGLGVELARRIANMLRQAGGLPTVGRD